MKNMKTHEGVRKDLHTTGSATVARRRSFYDVAIVVT